jgi:hypothetical protein
MMKLHPLSASLLVELHALEEDTYRLSLRVARRLGAGPPAAALRAVAGHAGEALHELPKLARSRGVRLRSFGALAMDTARRARDVVVGHVVDHEHGYRRALATMRRGVDLVRLTLAAARDEGDGELATWCRAWMQGRDRLIAAVAEELEWFVRHPQVARLARA